MASKKKSSSTKAESPSFEPINSFSDALEQSAPRPDVLAGREPKKAYAERLSNKIAVLIANRLRATGSLKGPIHPSEDGRGRETAVPSGAFNKAKKTDVNFSTLSGLELLVSIKTLGFRDVITNKITKEKRLGRYTKNMVRNDHELRAEAMEFHERYPFAVLVALLFIPLDSCEDADTDKSSFAHAIMTFRSRSGRNRPDEPAQMFELFYIGLYEWEGPNAGKIRFFDVMERPPKRGIPKRLVELEDVIRRIVEVYGLRNREYIPWEDEGPGVPQILSQPPEDDAGDGDDDTEDDE